MCVLVDNISLIVYNVCINKNFCVNGLLIGASRVTYNVTSFEHSLEIRKWVMHSDTPELELRYVWTEKKNRWMTHVIASSSGETMLLLKYGHVLEPMS